MKVSNMVNSKGNKVANQFIIQDNITEMSGNCDEYFQSYDSIICKREKFKSDSNKRAVYLDIKFWDYSKTTSKYRNMFLGEDTKTIKAKIASGEYILTNLN